MEEEVIIELVILSLFIGLGFLFGFVYFDKNYIVSIIMIIILIIIGNLFDLFSETIVIISTIILIFILYMIIKKGESE